MGTTAKTIKVKTASVDEVIKKSKEFLASKGFRIKDKGDTLVCTRGLGLLTAQQRFILSFSKLDKDNTKIAGEFFILTYWFIKGTVSDKAIAGAIPRRKGYQLMQEYINHIKGVEI
ncbi:MAG: hypothetical protein JW822_03360 [Spirochaetales bacterium]|nr:hypothetical protein [Spirochaetales bacterium]